MQIKHLTGTEDRRQEAGEREGGGPRICLCFSPISSWIFQEEIIVITIGRYSDGRSVSLEVLLDL